jgi:glycerol uptake facilitator-like aquaporin
MNKYLAELVGTFVLALTVSISISLGAKSPFPTPVMAGLALGVSVYTLGAISGTHINPAITIGLAAIGKIGPKDAGLYLAAQFLGGGLALWVSRFLAAPPIVTVADTAAVFCAELLGTFFLATGVAAVVHGKAPAEASGLTIGGSLLIGVSAASSASNGVLNPAVALAIGSLSAMYVLGPIVGSILAMLIYNKFLAGPK